MANQTKVNLPNGSDRRLTPKQQAAMRRVQKRRRVQLILIGAIVLVVAALAIWIGLVVTKPTDWQSIPTATRIDERNFEVGPADAKVTVEMYTDYQCPACKAWHDSTERRLLNDYVEAKREPTQTVKLVYKQWAFLDANFTQRESHLMAEAAYCASDQKRFRDFHDALYNNQARTENSGFWTTGRLKELAQLLKLNTNDFGQCLDSGKYRNTIIQEASNARAKGVTSTPSFFVNGKFVNDGQDFNNLQKAIDEALNSPVK